MITHPGHSREQDVLGALPAAGLDDVMGNAGLMTRTDRKYLLPIAALPRALDSLVGLSEQTHVLEIGGRRHQRYDSTYVDTPELDGYLRTARGRRRRFKVRGRHYLDTQTSFTEVKTRGRRGTTVKTRVERPTAPAGVACDSLPFGDLAFVQDQLQGAGLLEVDAERLVPTLRTSYVRSTMWLPNTGARVTVDTHLTWSLPDGSRASAPHRAIIETKSPGASAGVDRALWALGHRPVRLSKYGVGLLLLRPGLPANRWHRVIARHLLSPSNDI